jgi:hypothetical protein
MENQEQKEIQYLPLGSVAIVKGGVKKIMVVARGIATKFNDKIVAFDYAGCLYPEGIMDEQLMYFNHEDIAKVYFEAFSDEDNEIMLENIKNWAKNNELEKGDPLVLNNNSKEDLKE